MDKAGVAEQLRAINSELARRAMKDNPVAWAEEKLGDTLWSVQKKILKAIQTHRKVAVASCHEIGKSFISGRAVAWWLDSNPAGEAFVVTSAPSTPQVRTILWREIGRAHIAGNLPGRINQTEWLMDVNGREEQVAIGRKPNDYDPTAFQGIHARRLLFVFDEACGMPVPLWEAADSLIANDLSRGLAFGNPDDPYSEFAQVCKPDSGWHVIHVSAFDTPNFTGEEVPERIKEVLIGRQYVEDRRRKWAKNWYWVDKNGKQTDWHSGVRVVCPAGVDPNQAGSYWHSKVLGQFPVITQDQGLIPQQWIKAAQDRDLEPNYPFELGVDVGGGGDASCGTLRKGPVARVIWQDHNPDTMQTCGNVAYHLQHTGSNLAKIDVVGIGKGVVDRGKELKLAVEGINVGEAADDPERFLNRRAELWWNVRELFEAGQIDIDPTDEELASELASIRFKRTSHGKIQIETKEEAKRRGVASPNRAESLMLAFSKPRWVLTSATWGR